jgi:hypothetical protein
LDISTKRRGNMRFVLIILEIGGERRADVIDAVLSAVDGSCGDVSTGDRLLARSCLNTWRFRLFEIFIDFFVFKNLESSQSILDF